MMKKSSIFGNKYRIDSARWQNWDYREKGFYFVTICVSERRYEFGYIENGKMVENNNAQLCRTAWNDLLNHFSNIRLDTFIIMPDHVHFIMEITKKTDTNLGNIVRGFKSKTTNLINTFNKAAVNKFWQSRFYDHVIRSSEELVSIRNYILNNPKRFEVTVETLLAASLANNEFQYREERLKRTEAQFLKTETQQAVSLQNPQL